MSNSNNSGSVNTSEIEDDFQGLVTNLVASLGQGAYMGMKTPSFPVLKSLNAYETNQVSEFMTSAEDYIFNGGEMPADVPEVALAHVNALKAFVDEHSEHSELLKGHYNYTANDLLDPTPDPNAYIESMNPMGGGRRRKSRKGRKAKRSRKTKRRAHKKRGRKSRKSRK